MGASGVRDVQPSRACCCSSAGESDARNARTSWSRSAHKLFRNREVELTAKEFGVLEFFATRAGRALTRDDILNQVWGHSVVVTPRSIDRCVTTLRAKLETGGNQPSYIHTIRNVGYRFEPGDSLL